MLVLVVGPSGAGKDSIINGARAALAGDPQFVFPRRAVTRKADVTAEDHDSISEMAFALKLIRGDYAMWWKAHGNCYGIPIAIDDDLRMGRTVVFNCSRTVLDEVQKHYDNVAVAEIQVPSNQLVERIVARGRETREQAVIRASRDVPPLPPGTKSFAIHNDGALGNAIGAFCRLLRDLDHTGSDPGRGALYDQHQNEDCDDGGRRLVVVKQLQRHLELDADATGTDQAQDHRTARRFLQRKE